MRTAYVLLPALCAAPFLPACTSLTTSLASYGASAVAGVQRPAESPEMYYDVGRYYQAQNQWERAARAYERALALRSDYVEAANALATCYAMQGQYDRAVAQLENALKGSPGSVYLQNNLGYVYYLQGKLPEAIAALEAVTRAEPQNGRAWRNLALAYGKAGATEKSREAYARANRPTPRALLETWKQAHPSADTAVAQTSQTIKPASAPVAAPATPAAMPEARTAPSLEVVSVTSNIYELRVVQPAPVAQRDATVRGTTVGAQPALPLKSFRVEVSNGNGATGMARRVAHTLKQAGLNTVRLTNQIPWQRASEIQFSHGYALEAAKLAGMLGHEVLTVRNDGLRRDINVRLVLGKDVRNETAFLTPRHGTEPISVASVK